MKLVEIIRPINTQKKRELERELELEKLRFKQATQNAASRFRGNILERRWFKEHPIETSLLILLGGYCIARWKMERSLDVEKS